MARASPQPHAKIMGPRPPKMETWKFGAMKVGAIYHNSSLNLMFSMGRNLEISLRLFASTVHLYLQLMSILHAFNSQNYQN
jgi:hypothetical protein